MPKKETAPNKASAKDTVAVEIAEEARPSPFDLLDDGRLSQIAADARAASEIVAATVNPLNVFALKYLALAEACEALTALCMERGHRGIQE